MFAGNQHGGVGSRHALDRAADLDDGRRVAKERRGRPALQTLVGFLESLVPAHRPPEFHLGPRGREQLVVIPGLFDVVARPAPHGFDGAGDAAPGRHHEDRQRRIERADPLHQVEPFLA